MSDDAHIDHAKLQQRFLIHYDSSMGPRFASSVLSSERQAREHAELFRADGYPARIVKLTVENGQPVSRWVEPDGPTAAGTPTSEPG